MARLVGDQLEQDQPELAAFEHPARTPAAAAAAAEAFVAEVEVERSPAALPAAAATHGHQAIRQVDLDPPARAAADACIS